MTTVKQKLAYLAVTAIPIFLWAKLIHRYLHYRKHTAERENAHSKHNCVVTYSRDAGMFGWPDYPDRLPLNLKCYDKFLEPVQYFIDTAQQTLDVSVMILNSEILIKTLLRAAKRGVKIRIILDRKYDDAKLKMRDLMRHGAKVIYDEKSNSDSMMHNKYAVKDFNTQKRTGYSLCGSLNWTQSAFNENYEFMVLSSNDQVVAAFHKNFEESWECFKKARLTNILNDKLYEL